MITYLLHNLTRLPAAPNPTVECAFQSYSQDDNSKKIIGYLKGNIDDCVAQSFPIFDSTVEYAFPVLKPARKPTVQGLL